MLLCTPASVAATTLLLVFGGTLSAQQQRERDDAHLRNDCRLAVQTLSSGEPEPHRAWARAIITRCDDSGPAALRDAWSGIGPDSSDLEWLVDASSRIRDARLLQTATDVASDGARPTLVRLSSLRVLISYFAPDETASLAKLLMPPQPTTIGWCCLSSRADFFPIAGTASLPDDRAARIKSVLSQLATSDRDPVVRKAAEFVLKNL